MRALFITLAILIAMMALIWLLRWRQGRAQRPTSPDPIRPHARASRPERSSPDHSTSLTTELGVWRPPPREQLLARQKALRLAVAEPANERLKDKNRRWITGDPRRRHPFGREEQVDEPARSERTAPQVMDQVSSLPVGEPPTSRIGRRRQGLESLITELPSVTEKDRDDSNAR